MPTNEHSSKSRPFRARSARDLGVAVKYFRMLNGLSQAELAARAGIHRTYLTELEGGRATEAMERLMSLFSELGVRVTIALED
jgi:transcriptional regulator with XRE-family HTH domain